LAYLERIIRHNPTTTNKSKENARHFITIRFNNDEWDDIKRGISWLYADEMIPKPTAYGFLKWCGLTASSSLEKRHRGNI
jgi:hypothetical protein